MTTDYSQINQLEETVFIAGTKFTLYFVAYEDDGVNRKNLTGITPKWVLSPYGQTSYTALQKTSTVTSAAQGEFKVELVTTDTLTLSGKYIQQPVIGESPNQYRLAQGIVTILPAITVS
jgi:hypothetical protein